METNEQRHCQVCGGDLEGKLVWCSHCSTPHHADCWEFAGGCSTYGCGTKKALDERPHVDEDKELVIIENVAPPPAPQADSSKEIIYVVETEEKVADKETIKALILKEKQLSYRALAFLTSPAYSFWETLYKAGPAAKKSLILRHIFDQETIDLINSIIMSIIGFLLTSSLVFLHVGPIYAYALMAYLILGPFAHLHFKSFFKADDEKRAKEEKKAITAAPKHKHKRSKRSRKRSKRRRYRRKKRKRH